MIDSLIDCLSLCTELSCQRRQPLCNVHKQVLHCCDFRLFTADTASGTTLTACCFLTLIAKHFLFHDKYLRYFLISTILPSGEMTATSSGISLSLASIARFIAYSIPPQHGTVILVRVILFISLFLNISVSFSE